MQKSIKKIFFYGTILNMLFFSACSSRLNQADYQKNLVGSFEQDSNMYRAIDDLFTLKFKDRYGDSMMPINDQISEYGYSVDFSTFPGTLSGVLIFRDNTTLEDYEKLTKEFIKNNSAWAVKKHNNVSEIDNFKIVSDFYRMKKNINDNFEIIYTSYFCYNDSIQLYLNYYETPAVRFRSDKEDIKSAKSKEKYFITFLKNIKFSPKIYTKGIPRPEDMKK